MTNVAELIKQFIIMNFFGGLSNLRDVSVREMFFSFTGQFFIGIILFNSILYYFMKFY